MPGFGFGEFDRDRWDQYEKARKGELKPEPFSQPDPLPEGRRHTQGFRIAYYVGYPPTIPKKQEEVPPVVEDKPWPPKWMDEVEV